MDKALKMVSSNFTKVLIELEKAAQAETDLTPSPSWATDEQFALAEEVRINVELAACEQKMTEIRLNRESLLEKLNEAVALKGLLFEKGKPLERSIIMALKLLGFKAEPYKEADSEFDVVFVAPDGKRLLGEAEGKDNKPISIDKLDQLDRNVREDFQRSDLNEYAKGVLFGNASRFTIPDDRGPFFTEKCLIGAKRSGDALVRTTDLFRVARYLEDHVDPQFASMCRKAILETSGAEVVFPPIPELPKSSA